MQSYNVNRIHTFVSPLKQHKGSEKHGADKPVWMSHFWQETTVGKAPIVPFQFFPVQTADIKACVKEPFTSF